MKSLLLAAALLLGSGSAAADIFLCTGGGIAGSVQDPDFVRCIAITSYQAGVATPESGQVGSGRTRGPAEFTDFVLSKAFDLSTLGLRRAAIQGQAFPEWSVHFLTTGCGNQRLEYQRINVKNVLVSSVNETATDDGTAAEVLTLNFEEVEWIQTTYDDTCQVTGTETFAWNIADGAQP